MSHMIKVSDYYPETDLFCVCLLEFVQMVMAKKKLNYGAEIDNIIILGYFVIHMIGIKKAD